MKTINNTPYSVTIVGGGGSGSGIEDIEAGDNISIDKTNPSVPVISSIGGGGGSSSKSVILVSDGEIDSTATVVVIAGGSEFTMDTPLDGHVMHIMNLTGSAVDITSNVNTQPDSVIPISSLMSVWLGIDSTAMGTPGTSWQYMELVQA